MPGIDFPPKPNPKDEQSEEGSTFQEECDRAREAMRTAPATETGSTLAEERAKALETLRATPASASEDGPTLKEQQEAARQALRKPAEEGAAPHVQETVGTEPEEEPISDATPKERMDRMRSAVVENALTRMREAEASAVAEQEKYFSLMAAHQKSRGMVSVAAESLIGEITPEKLRSARRAWVRSRALVAQAQQEAAEARIKERPQTREQALEGLNRYKGKGSIEAEKLQARHERMVTLKSVVLGAEEAELKVRTEALSARDKNAFERGIEWYQTRVPKGARIVITSALMVGGAAALTGLSPVALMAASAGAGLRVAAATVNNPKWQKVFGTIALLPSVGGLVGLAAEKATQGVHKALGTEVKAAELLAQREGLGKLGSVKNLEKLSQERKKALGVKETIARQGRFARMGSSLLAGGLLGHLFGGHHAGSGAAPEGHSASGDTSHMDTAHAPATHTAQPEAAAPGAAHGEAVHDVPRTPDGIVSGATIHTPGEGFGEMVMEFKRNLHEQAGGLTPSPALKHVLDSDPNALSREIGALTGEGSITMHQGDQLFVDESQNVWFQAQGHEPQLLFHNDPAAPGGFVHHTIDAPMPHVPEVHTPAAHPVHEDPSAALNRAQVESSAPPAASVTVEHIEAVKPFDGSDIKPMPQPTHLDTTIHDAPSVETHPAPTAPEASGQPHPFAHPGEGPALNAHGVDLNKPQMVMSDGRIFAHGTDTENSYVLAAQYSKKLAESGAADTRVYFVARDYNDLGQPYDAVRVVFTPKDSLPQIAPYGSGVSLPQEFIAPPVPKDADYQPLGK